MRRLCMMIAVAAVLLAIGCSSTPSPQSATLQCRAYGGEFYGFYSLTTGEVTPPIDPDRVDILYYFDSDDCSQGALIGHDDRPGYLFPIGRKPWSELATLEPPPDDMESVGAIAPLTESNEGLAFWVKRPSGEYVLARIRAVQPASYSDLIAGGNATVELEWIRPQTRGKGNEQP